jgi:predicted ribosomally synthesized peptide with nif11-like leader
MEERLQQLKEKAEADSSLGEKLLSQDTPEAVQSLLKAEGLEFSLEEIMTLRDALVKYVEKRQGGELSDADLEEVAGGMSIPLIVAGAIMSVLFPPSAVIGAALISVGSEGKW